MTTFSSMIEKRWPHFVDGQSPHFLDGVTQAELRRLALETQLDDKIMSRAHLQHKAHLLPNLLYSGQVASLRFETLPQQYVVKPRCQSGSIMIIDRDFDLVSRRTISPEDIVASFKDGWCYRSLNNDIVVEGWVRNADGSLCTRQAKCYVFGGRVELIMYKLEGWNQNKVYTYTRDWRRIYSNLFDRPIEQTVEQPENLEKLISVAEDLGEYYHAYTGIAHVRVDLFDADTGPIFSEFTGGSNAGKGYTPEVDAWLGSLWKTAQDKRLEQLEAH